jgi:hypothetical protein
MNGHRRFQTPTRGAPMASVACGGSKYAVWQCILVRCVKPVSYELGLDFLYRNIASEPTTSRDCARVR